MKPKVDDKNTMNSSISRQKVAHWGLFKFTLKKKTCRM